MENSNEHDKITEIFRQLVEAGGKLEKSTCKEDCDIKSKCPMYALLYGYMLWNKNTNAIWATADGKVGRVYVNYDDAIFALEHMDEEKFGKDWRVVPVSAGTNISFLK